MACGSCGRKKNKATAQTKSVNRAATLAPKVQRTTKPKLVKKLVFNGTR